MQATFVVVGGGIAGVTCAETLTFYAPDSSVILLSASALVKSVINLHAITQTLSDFDIEEQHMNDFMQKHPNVKVIHDSLSAIEIETNEVFTSGGLKIQYQYLCLCLGAKPKLIKHAVEFPQIVGIRDTDSVEYFISKLRNSSEVAIVGNGGIASELVYKIENVKIHWIIKDKHITATFIDPGAAEFLKDKLQKSEKTLKTETQLPSKRMRFENDLKRIRKSGAALGPDWYKDLDIKGSLEVPESVQVHFEAEILEIKEKPDTKLEILLNNDQLINCDFIISATGVEPRSDLFHVDGQPIFAISEDKGILVNEFLQSSVDNIYVAGDLCTPSWTHAPQWFPMKLWTQARQMGAYAAKCMAARLDNEIVYQDFCFELFTHTTKLFGYKVVLLGLYNGQKLGQDYEILLRMTKGEEFIKFVLKDHKLQGAVLIGDTDLEETCENLILNQIDLSSYKEDLLNPDIDIEDYFD